MSSKQKEKNTKPQRQNSSSPFPKIEKMLAEHSNRLVYWILGIGIVFAFLIFNARILETDDGLYIEGGYYYAKNFFGYYFTSSAALYVMFLALPISIFGINLLIVKSLSVLFYTVGMFYFYKSFQGKVANVVFIPVLAISSLNATILTYASLTFTESFYMMLQSIFIAVFFSQLGKEDIESEQVFKNIKGWLLIGGSILLLSLTKNIAAATVGGVFIYFVIQKKYKNAFAVIGSYAVLFTIVEVIKKILWGDLIVSQFGGQSKMILLKNPYDPNSGQESLWGFVDRFTGNSQIFLSSRFMEILSLRSEPAEPNILITIVVASAIVFGIYRIVKNNDKPLIAMSSYVVVVCLATFISLHTSWGQTRYIMIFVPFFLLIIFYGLYDLCKKNSAVIYKVLFVGVAGGLLIVNVYTTVEAANKNYPILQKNLQGDIFYGYPQEWASYLRLSQWCADSLSAESFVACRKPSVSFIYGRGKSYQGIYNVPSENADSLLNQLHRPGVTHIILDNIAGTVNRYMNIIETKYPGTFEFMRQEGKERAAAYLFKINYRK